MTRILPLIAGAFLAPCVAAQEPAAAQTDAYETLLADFAKAEKVYTKKRSRITKSDEYKKLRLARDLNGIRKLVAQAKAPHDSFVPRFLEIARARKGTPTEAKSLLWIVMNAREAKSAAKQAIDGLLTRHLHAEQTWQLALNSFYIARHVGNDGMADALNTIVDNSKHKEAVAEALYARATARGAGRNRGADARKRREADFARIRETAPESAAALRIDGAQFKREKLQMGMVAPDIEGEDIDGVKFKLSDYRGKVVVLDFWGDW